MQKQALYRNYTSWLMASEPRFAFFKLERAQFRRLFVWLVVAACYLSFLSWQRMQVVKLAYDISAMRKTRDQLAYTQTLLKQRVMELSSLPHAEDVARKRLGMVNADPKQLFYVKGTESPGGPSFWQKLKGLFQ